LSTVIFNGTYFALGTDGSIISSSDGSNWTAYGQVSNALGQMRMRGLVFAVIFNLPVYIAVGDGGNIFTSGDAKTWNQVTAPVTTNDLNSITLLNGNFVVTGAGGTLLVNNGNILNSDDDGNGNGWQHPVTKTSNTLRAAAFNSNVTIPNSPSIPTYVVVGDAGTIITTTDPFGLSNWIPAPSVPPSVQSQSLASVVLGGTTASRFVAVGQGGTVTWSDDGQNWNLPDTPPDPTDLTKVLFAPSMFFAVGAGGANAVSR
jgi:hypothetical protein